MPIALVNDAGAVMHYEDSGAPAGSSTYLTMVIIHGFIFHGAGFLPLFKHAASNNLRIVTANLRDYPGSTPYTPLELEKMCSSDIEDQRIAVLAHGQEIAAFLKQVIFAGNLPPVREMDGKKTGGVILLSWSLGNIWSLSMFGNAEQLDADTKSVLHRFLRTLVMYVPPHYPLGVPCPREIFYVGQEPATLDKQGSFGRWVSAFYTPQRTLTSDIPTLARRVPMHTVFSDPRWAPTVDRMSPDELASLTDPSVLSRSGRCLETTDMRVWWENAQRALFDCSVQEHDPFRGVNAIVLWCDMGAGTGPFTANHIAERLKEATAQGKVVRNIDFLKIEGANHLVHWHESERFLEAVLEKLK